MLLPRCDRHAVCWFSGEILSPPSFPHGAWLCKRQNDTAAEPAEQSSSHYGRRLGPQDGGAEPDGRTEYGTLVTVPPAFGAHGQDGPIQSWGAATGVGQGQRGVSQDGHVS
jgi:hypothetical protein